MSEPKGTANILRQHSSFESLAKDYSAQTASELAARSLNQHGVATQPSDVLAWNKINRAASDGKMDLDSERNEAEGRANVAATEIIASAAANGSSLSAEDPPLEVNEPAFRASLSNEDSVVDANLSDSSDYGNSDDEDEDEDEDDDGGGPSTIHEIYDCNTLEDSEEQALDDVLKLMENES